MNHVELTYPTPQARDGILDLMEVRTDSLEGEALAWAAGKADGLDLFLEGPSGYLTNWRVFQRYAGQALVFTKLYNPHEDLSLAAPWIDSHGLAVQGAPNQVSDDVAVAGYCRNGLFNWSTGTTAAIALCRALIRLKFGDIV
ncbi:DUF2591 domain-containing protein [Pseudomonas asiatica]|uniref:DUF2591 domain-containing protein n=1 Tax=Pseudomonas asiatica TaxID=2219225 RepID=UPI00345CBB94